jgi:hypothetical protein
MLKFRVFEDPGHAWIEVPMWLIRRLQIHDKITQFSYVKGNMVYLEEDCDYATFRTAYREQLQSLPVLIEGESVKNDSPVRNYRRYDVDEVMMNTADWVEL